MAHRAALLLLFAAVPSAAPAQAPAATLQHAVELSWDNENAAERFAYDERWQNKNFDTTGMPVIDETALFEAVEVEGKPYLRMVSRNGERLNGEAAAQQEQAYDSAVSSGAGLDAQAQIRAAGSQSLGLGLNLNLLPRYFDAKAVGVEAIDGRPALHLDCMPRHGAKPPDRAERKGLDLHVQVWIDQADGDFSQVSATLMRNRDGMLAGATAQLTWAQVDGVWLPRTMAMRGQFRQRRQLVRVETSYTFFAYKRFRVDTRVLNDGASPRP